MSPSLWIVLIITATVDCRSGQRKSEVVDRSKQLREETFDVAGGTAQDRETLKIAQDLPANITLGDLDKDIEKEGKGNEDEDRVGWCNIKLPCSIAGGHCVTDPNDCRYGRLIPNGCKGNLCQCCIPGCPEDQGFFRTHTYNQCFKLFVDKPSNWADANQTCHDAGLVLAKPLETIILKNYLTMRYGDLSNNEIRAGHPVTAWLDAKADGSCMRWNRGPYGCISSVIPIWWPGQPVVSVGRCLLLTSNSNDWKNNPEKSLYALPCDVADRVPLCELLM